MTVNTVRENEKTWNLDTMGVLRVPVKATKKDRNNRKKIKVSGDESSSRNQVL